MNNSGTAADWANFKSYQLKDEVNKLRRELSEQILAIKRDLESLRIKLENIK